jgi:hypothetical protein
MNKDLVAINEEIDILLEKNPSMEKYQRLGALFVCKMHIEKMFKTEKSTVIEVLEDKMDKIGARSTLLKLEPILSKHIKDLEMIAPTISGEFIKQLKEM